jgi:hypothetical protein
MNFATGQPKLAVVLFTDVKVPSASLGPINDQGRREK